jgi:hypothetical protein
MWGCPIVGLLSDAENGANLWTERFDSDTGDLFAVQNEITRRIAVALNLELIGAEAARPIEHPDALDYILRGRALLMKPPTRDNRAEAIVLFNRALALDPESITAQSWLARTLAVREPDEMTSSVAEDVARAEELVAKAFFVSRVASPVLPLNSLGCNRDPRNRSRQRRSSPITLGESRRFLRQGDGDCGSQRARRLSQIVGRAGWCENCVQSSPACGMTGCTPILPKCCNRTRRTSPLPTALCTLRSHDRSATPRSQARAYPRWSSESPHGAENQAVRL